MRLNFIALLSVCALAIPALADAPTPSTRAQPGLFIPGETVSPADIQLQARPLFGPGTPATSGWVPYLIHLTNRGKATAVGTVQLQARPKAEDKPPHVFAELAFSVAPESVAHLQLPIHDAAIADLLVAAFSSTGEPLATATASNTGPSEPMLVDLTEPSVIGPTLRGRALSTRFVPSAFIHYAVPALAVASLQRDLLDDHLLLPEQASGYASATLVLSRSSQFVGLPSSDLKALVGWVLAGGSLALVIDRPKDLKAPSVSALVGGPIEEQRIDPEQAGLAPGDPSVEVQEDLLRYSGSNLRATPWGTAASYGLGEVHLLSFDPTQARPARDPWVQEQLLSLVSYAWDRGAQLVLPLGTASFEDQIQSELRAALDPSQASLWAIFVAGFILIGYAAVAGPLNFFLGRRAGSGLKALGRVPLWAAITSASLVLLGMASKGGSGHAQRLTLLEMGAGIGRGAAVRYRAFFTNTESLNVAPSMNLSLMDVLGPREQVPRSLEMGAQGARLTSLHHRPWQTVFVREDGLMDLEQGVALISTASKIRVVNRTGQDLVAALLHLPGGELRFFPRIVRGAQVSATAGDLVRVATGSPPRSLHPLDLSALKYRMDRVAPGSGDAWLALQATSYRSVDWWPADVPTLIAQVDTAQHGRDSGLPLREDRLLVRVIGLGGAP